MPRGHRKTTTFIGGLRLSGMTAPMVLDGSMTAVWFLADVEQILGPTLAPGDIVILDSLAARRSDAGRATVEIAGPRLLFLPPCSPDLHPIEDAFSRLEAPLRKAATRNVEQLWNAIANAIDAFAPSECANDFTAAGYDSG